MVQDDFERNYFLKDIPLQAAQDKYNNHLNEIKFTDARTTETVSYTHLTLPTIGSV